MVEIEFAYSSVLQAIRGGDARAVIRSIGKLNVTHVEDNGHDLEYVVLILQEQKAIQIDTT